MKQFNFGTKNKYLDHCAERWEGRVNKDSERLLMLIDTLNNNVPEEWILTRYSPDFLIEDIVTGAVLAGTQYRTESDTTIVKEIMTVLGHGQGSRDKLSKNYSYAKAGRPNIIIDEEKAWVRQYELVATSKPKSTSIQYFQMNELRDKELIPGPKWLKWGNSSDPKWIERKEISENYHTEDYWQLPMIGMEK